MYISRNSWEPGDNWSVVRESLRPTDTEQVRSQLQVMGRAEISYPDDTEMKWKTDLGDRYERLVDSFGGEENVQQYMEIDGGDLKVAVEQDQEPLFYLSANEETYLSIPGLDLWRGTLS
ncbi:MAG: hypothetical protein ABEJ87_04475 [Candidatus Nanohalobium sp.]